MIAPHELGSTLIDILAGHGLMQSKGAASRLIEQGGLYVGDEAVTELFTELTENLFTNNELIIRLGKKRYIKLIIEN